MEVHHHSNHEKRKWTHYLWEFLMLFLAVFCGFLAENFREHLVEKKREKQYMVALIEDLKEDTASFSRVKSWYAFMNSRYDSVITNLRPPISKEQVLNYYNEAINFINFTTFAYHDRTIEQLKSTGSYRLIHDTKVSDSLQAYDSRMRGVFSYNNKTIEENRLAIRKQMADILDEAIFRYTSFQPEARAVFS